MSDSNDDSYSDDEEEELDPRIQDELEKLNAATNSINHLEAELDESRAVFRQTLAGATYQLNGLAAKLGKCVEKSRPFYESYRQLKQAHYMLQKSTNQYERASGMHVAAKTRVTEAEIRVFGWGEKRAFDTALQEMLNQATIEVNDAEKKKRESWKKHQEDLQAYRELEAKVKQLLKKLKSSVEKAKPYFELKSEFDRHLWQLKLRVDSIHKGLAGAKENYSACLKSLEVISDDIHEKRKSKRMDEVLAKLHEREAGVGADSSNEDEPSLTPSNLDLNFDSSLKFDDIDGLAAGRSNKKEDDDWSSIPPTVVVIDSEDDHGRIYNPFTRTVAGCEGDGELGIPPTSQRQEVYGHESGSEEEYAVSTKLSFGEGAEGSSRTQTDFGYNEDQTFSKKSKETETSLDISGNGVVSDKDDGVANLSYGEGSEGSASLTTDCKSTQAERDSGKKCEDQTCRKKSKESETSLEISGHESVSDKDDGVVNLNCGEGAEGSSHGTTDCEELTRGTDDTRDNDAAFVSISRSGSDNQTCIKEFEESETKSEVGLHEPVSEEDKEISTLNNNDDIEGGCSKITNCKLTDAESDTKDNDDAIMSNTGDEDGIQICKKEFEDPDTDPEVTDFSKDLSDYAEST